MEPLTKTLDIEEELQNLQADRDDLQRQIEERVDDAEAVYPPQDDDEQETYLRLGDEVDVLENALVATKGYIEALERATAEWEGTEITIRELSGQETRIIQDEAQRKAMHADPEQVVSEGVHEVEFLKRTVESTPPGAPDPSDIHNLPNRLFDWLSGRANALNSVGEFSVGNSSLKERLTEREQANS